MAELCKNAKAIYVHSVVPFIHTLVLMFIKNYVATLYCLRIEALLFVRMFPPLRLNE